MQGERGASRQERVVVNWSPCTQLDPAERIDSQSHTPLMLSAHKYTVIMLWLCPQMMSPFSACHLCISALDLFIIET